MQKYDDLKKSVMSGYCFIFVSDISYIFSISDTFFHIFSPSSWKRQHDHRTSKAWQISSFHISQSISSYLSPLLSSVTSEVSYWDWVTHTRISASAITCISDIKRSSSTSTYPSTVKSTSGNSCLFVGNLLPSSCGIALNESVMVICFYTYNNALIQRLYFLMLCLVVERLV